MSPLGCSWCSQVGTVTSHMDIYDWVIYTGRTNRDEALSVLVTEVVNCPVVYILTYNANYPNS